MALSAEKVPDPCLKVYTKITNTVDSGVLHPK